MDLDQIDRQILEVVGADARVSMTALAQTVRISRASAHARFKRLIDSGIISGFTAQIDPILTGHHASAYVTMSLDQAQWQQARDQLQAIPEVHQISLVGGEFDVIVLVRARDNYDLRRIVLEEIQAIPSVRTTHTQIIFEDIQVSPRSLHGGQASAASNRTN